MTPLTLLIPTAAHLLLGRLRLARRHRYLREGKGGRGGDRPGGRTEPGLLRMRRGGSLRSGGGEAARPPFRQLPLPARGGRRRGAPQWDAEASGGVWVVAGLLFSPCGC